MRSARGAGTVATAAPTSPSNSAGGMSRLSTDATNAVKPTSRPLKSWQASRHRTRIHCKTFPFDSPADDPPRPDAKHLRIKTTHDLLAAGLQHLGHAPDLDPAGNPG